MARAQYDTTIQRGVKREDDERWIRRSGPDANAIRFHDPKAAGYRILGKGKGRLLLGA